jgi:Ras-related protein Rab-11A
MLVTLCGLTIRTATNTYPEIYRIVSSKALDQGEGGGPVLGNDRKVLEISKSADAEQKKGCC